MGHSGGVTLGKTALLSDAKAAIPFDEHWLPSYLAAERVPQNWRHQIFGQLRSVVRLMRDCHRQSQLDPAALTIGQALVSGRKWTTRKRPHVRVISSSPEIDPPWRYGQWT